MNSPRLPQPASGHNSYWDWGPPAGNPDRVIAIGRDRARLDAAFTQVTQLGVVETPGGVRNMEHGTPIWLASGLRRPWNTTWPGFRSASDRSS